ncbi:MAG: hypothetical protein WBB67_03245 [bacterium]
MKSSKNNLGWVKFHRIQWDHWVSKDKPYCRGYVWLDLYSSANHQDNTILFDGRPMLIKRGQRLTSITKLSAKYGWGYKKTSNFLNRLEEQKMIKQKRTSRYTLITIENYDLYQPRKRKRQNRGKTGEEQRQTNKNDKEGKKNPLTSLPNR